MLKALVAAVVIVTGFVGGLFGAHVQTPQTPVAGSYSPTGGGSYRIGQSVGTTDTTIKLSSFKEPVSSIPYTMSYLGSDIEYGTLSPQSSVSEFISFSGISQNADGSATLTGVVRGMSRTPGTGGCVASTTLAQPHSGQSIFILSNPPCQLAEYLPLRSNSTSSAIVTFSSTTPPRYDSNYNASGNQFVSFAQLSNTAIQGAATSTFSTMGISQLATQTQVGASTASSTEGRPLVLSSKFSTTTCQSAVSLVLVASSTTGKLAGGCFDQTYPYSFTGTTTFATSTIASTTIQNGLNVLGTTTLQGPISGISGKLYLNTAPSSVVNTTGTTTVFSFSLPANTLSTSNIVHIHANIHGMGVDASAGGGGVGVFYGGVNGGYMRLDVAAQTFRGAGALDMYLVGSGATNTQKMTTTIGISATSTAPSEGGASASKSMAIDSTVAQTIQLDANVTNSANFFEFDLVTAELIK